MSRFLQVILSFFALLCTNTLAISAPSCADQMTVVGLIQPYWVHLDFQQLNGRRTIYYFINSQGNPLLLKPNLAPQHYLLHGKPVSTAFQRYINKTLQRLSKVINLSFVRIYDRKKSDFTINATCAPDDQILGESAGLMQHSNQINIIVNFCANNTLVLHKTIHSVFLHELGHVLGLEHPFDDRDNDCIFTTKAWSQHSATKTDTQMAYRFHGELYNWYRPHDIQALIAIWGTAKKM